MNILFLTYVNTDACAYYRSAGIIPELQRKTNDNITVAQWDQVVVNWPFIIGFDLIMFQRPGTIQALQLCEYIKHCNRKLWIDYDDNLLCVPAENPNHWTYDKPETKEIIKKLIAIADVVTVTTEDLKQSFSEFNSNIWVIPNAFNDFLFKRNDLPKRSNMIAWRGSDTHIWDLMSHGKAIAKAAAEFPDKQFLYLGYYPWFLPKTNNQFALESLDIILYFSNIYRLAPMAVHVPLVDELFNRCKSNIAAIEAAYFGAVCIQPDWWDIPGNLTYSNEIEYYEALKAVLSGEVDTVAQNEIAWDYVCDNLALSKVNVQRIELINSL